MSIARQCLVARLSGPRLTHMRAPRGCGHPWPDRPEAMILAVLAAEAMLIATWIQQRPCSLPPGSNRGHAPCHPGCSRFPPLAPWTAPPASMLTRWRGAPTAVVAARLPPGLSPLSPSICRRFRSAVDLGASGRLAWWHHAAPRSVGLGRTPSSLGTHRQTGATPREASSQAVVRGFCQRLLPTHARVRLGTRTQSYAVARSPTQSYAGDFAPLVAPVPAPEAVARALFQYDLEITFDRSHRSAYCLAICSTSVSSPSAESRRMGSKPSNLNLSFATTS